MATVLNKGITQRLAMLFLAMQGMVWKASVALAQDTKDVNVDVNLKGNGGTAWYGIWWVWVLVAVFIIVIVAITSRGGGTNREG